MGNTPKLQSGDRRARAAAARKQAAAKERKRRLVVTVITGVAVAAVIGVLVAVALAGGGSKSGNPSQVSAPNWPAPTGDAAKAAVASAGLQAFGQEMLTYHVHAHLDIIDQGTPVTVPAQIGFIYGSNGQPSGLTSLHTHQPDGIIHMEAPKPTTFTLGQFFKEWQVRLTSSCVGSLCADSTHSLGVWVDGKAHTGDPASITLTAHEEIAIVYYKKGTSPNPPSSFDFPAGD